jgi:hypothetical protein
MKNFALLKNSIYTDVINSLKEDRPRAKKIVKGYINIMKNNPILKEALHIHNNLEHGCFKNEDVKHGFIVENLNAIKTLNKKKLLEGLSELDKFIKDNNIQYSPDLSVLSERISNLILNINRIDKSIENNQGVECIIENIVNRNDTEENRDPVDHKLLKQVSSEKFNEKYTGLSECEKKVVQGFFFGNKNLIHEEYNKIITEVKGIIDEKIKNSDDKDIKIKFYEVKDKLIDYPENITLEHFKKLFTLKENLSK